MEKIEYKNGKNNIKLLETFYISAYFVELARKINFDYGKFPRSLTLLFL